MHRLLTASVLAASLVAASCAGSDGPTEPPAPQVTTVTVTPGTSTLNAVGASVQLQATARDATGRLVSGVTFTWASSNAAVVSVSSTGMATAVAAGSASVTATAGGVGGSSAITVTEPPAACAAPRTVSLGRGQAQAFDATDCVVLPSGAPGDRYRVIMVRPSAAGVAGDTVRATLSVTALGGVTASPMAAPILAAVGAGFRLPEAADADVQRAVRTSLETERFHVQLRQREAEMLRTMPRLTLARERAAGGPTAPARSSPPAPTKITLDISTASNCATSAENKRTALLIHENADLILYQDSTQNATRPIPFSVAQLLLDHYSSYGRQVIENYFGKPSDIDGNGKVLIFATPIVPENVAAFVWSGDFFVATGPQGCPASNEREMMYFSTDLILALEGSGTNFQALETVTHEMKHVVSLYHRIAASLRVGSSQYHPIWVEEGRAEIAAEMSSRTAWAANGGPAVGQPIRGASFTGVGFTRDNFGVIIKLARTVRYLSSQPNGLTVTPAGAQPGSDVYGSGWLFHRWLGDAYGQAGVAPYRDASLFRTLTDSLSAPGTGGIVARIGKPFLELFDEFARAVSIHGTGAPQFPLDFTTYEFVTAAEIFCNPNPLGVFPWPVTSTGTPGDCSVTPRIQESQFPSASFASREFTGLIGASGIRIHDFLSNGTGIGAQVHFTMPPPAKVWVVRLQ